MPGLTLRQNGFQELVQALSDKLGPSRGIDSDDVDPSDLQKLMEDYVSKESEWCQYALASEHVPYTRNLVDKGNGKSNLLILVWGPNKQSPIHELIPWIYVITFGSVLLHDEATSVADPWVDASAQETCRHSNAHCIMKILKGNLQETRYDWPTVAQNNNQHCPLEIISDKTYAANQCTYMSDKLGLHRIRNPHPTDYAISLHLYTPPNAAIYGCLTFDEKTGAPRRVNKCTFFSEYGQKRDATADLDAGRARVEQGAARSEAEGTVRPEAEGTARPEAETAARP